MKTIIWLTALGAMFLVVWAIPSMAQEFPSGAELHFRMLQKKIQASSELTPEQKQMLERRAEQMVKSHAMSSPQGRTLNPPVFHQESTVLQTGCNECFDPQ